MILRDTINSDTLLDLSPETGVLAAGEMSIAVNKSAGSFIVGPVSITSPFTNIRFSSGTMKLNTLLLSCMPSTIITPIPVFELDMPAKAISGWRSVLSLVLSTASG